MNPAWLRQRGFALLIVLWTVVLLMFLVTEIEQSGRGEARLADNLRRAAALQAEADGGIATAAYHLLGGAPAWAADGQDHALPLTGDDYARRLVLRIDDEAGKIDLNTAPAPLLAALVKTVSGQDGDAIAAAIVDWRFPAGLGGAVSTPYKNAGLPYGPPSAPFESVDELRLVFGVTPALLAAMAPHLTVYQEAGTSLAVADPVVRRAFVVAGPMVSASAAQPAGVHVVTVTATAYGAIGVAARRAVIRVGPQKDGWMQILTWTRPAT